MDGILVVDKPQGMTSRDVVNIVGKTLGTKKIGHTGTLDPNATGVLVLCIGKALKLVELLSCHDKTYQAQIILGIKTDTLDITGNILEKKDISYISKDMIEKTLRQFQGTMLQEVPLYSSIKVNGKKLYEYARNKESVVLPKREITIYQLSLIKEPVFLETIQFDIEVSVSKGTYIRSLARDIGLCLHTPSCMGNLRRIRQGIFKIDQAISLEDIKQGEFHIIPILDVLKSEKMIRVTKEMQYKVQNGQILPCFCKEDRCVLLDENGILLAIYQVYEKDKTKMKPYQMF